MNLGNYIPAKLNSVKIKDRQEATDIIKLLLECERDSRPYYPVLKNKFDTGNEMETCKKIFDYMKKNISYIKEPAKSQTGKTLGRILSDKFGDCKAFATFSICALKSCGIKANYRLASYKAHDKTPTHIYTIANVDGKKFVLDGVLDKFNNEASYKYAYDVKPI
jgi:hypothetical protein